MFIIRIASIENLDFTARASLCKHSGCCIPARRSLSQTAVVTANPSEELMGYPKGDVVLPIGMGVRMSSAQHNWHLLRTSTDREKIGLCHVCDPDPDMCAPVRWQC